MLIAVYHHYPHNCHCKKCIRYCHLWPTKIIVCYSTNFPFFPLFNFIVCEALWVCLVYEKWDIDKVAFCICTHKRLFSLQGCWLLMWLGGTRRTWALCWTAHDMIGLPPGKDLPTIIFHNSFFVNQLDISSWICDTHYDTAPTGASQYVLGCHFTSLLVGKLELPSGIFTASAP